jgi:GTPase Era involved in 16S rRNA processing
LSNQAISLAQDAEGDGTALEAFATALNFAILALRDAIGHDTELIHRTTALRDRLRDNRLQLAVLGQFKRGKSTFINALLGAAVLPVGVIPITAVPVFISWGQSPVAKVHFRDGSPTAVLNTQALADIGNFLFGFVAEEANPENRLGVSRVELFYPAALLAGGTVLIDTPGVGSTFRHNTEAALAVLPECDTALFVVSADPPLTETELDYLRNVKTKTARIFYILNKMDYLAVSERTQAMDFLRRVLEQNNLWTPKSEIFLVSARNALEAAERADADAVESAGIAKVKRYLVDQLAAEKSRLLETSMRSKALGILAESVSDISLRIETLKLPLNELIEKSGLFEASLRAIEERQRAIRDVLAGEQRTIREDIEKATASLRDQAFSYLVRLFTGELHDTTTRKAISTSIEELFDTGRAKLLNEFSRRTNSALASHARQVDADVNAVRQATAQLFQVPFSEFRELPTFALRHEPYWVTTETRTRLIPDVGGWLDRLLPRQIRTRRTRTRMLAKINDLIVRNAENLRWALLCGTDETFRKAGADIQMRLDDAVATTRNVVHEALARRSEASLTIDADLARLNHASTLLSALQHQIDPPVPQGTPAA